MLEKGANVNDKTDEGWTALMLASQEGHIEVVEELIKRGINIYEIEIAYMIIRKIAEDYVQLFISLNRDVKIEQGIKDEVHEYISFLYSLKKLPIEIFEEIIKKL